MKNIKNNQHYFKISQKNLESALDDFYIFQEKNKDLDKYIKNTKEIKKYLITIKTLIDKKEKDFIVDKYFRELAHILNKFSNCSEFSSFINACDNVLSFVKNDFILLKEITKRYFKYRILNEYVPEEWIQAVLDNNSSRKKGVCGENKLISILTKNNFIIVNNWEDFYKNKKCVAKFSKKFNLKNVRKELKIKIKTKKQNKSLDLIIKYNNNIFLLEAKHLNTCGGGQDKQISELIELLTLKENNKNIFYISFLDGNYSNILLGEKGNGDKIKEQRIQINKYLKEQENNFWLNTAGFISLVKDLK